MNTEEIRYFLQEIRNKTLKELESKRKTALYLHNIVIAGSVVFVLCLILFVAGVFYFGKEKFFKKISPLYENYIAPIDWLTGIFIALFAILCFLFYYWMQTRYIDAFKEQINKKLFKRLNPQIKYSADKYIPEEDFKKSNLFEDLNFNYEGDDYCSFNASGHLIEFSEIKASVHESTGQYSSTETIYFHGLFMKLHLKLQSGFIGIIPKQKNRGLLSFLEDKIVNDFKGKKKLDLEEDFGRKFDIYCDNISQAQKILTDDLKNNILYAHSQFDSDIYFSFQDSCVYTALPCGAFFEPVLRKPIQEESLKKTALLLNSFVSFSSSLVTLLKKSAPIS